MCANAADWYPSDQNRMVDGTMHLKWGLKSMQKVPLQKLSHAATATAVRFLYRTCWRDNSQTQPQADAIFRVSTC